MFCSKCGKEIHDEAVVCIHCGCEVVNTKAADVEAKEEDKVSVGLCILSFLIPLFGIIYWPLKHKSTPNKAQACGITAIVGWVINFIIIMLASGF